ncbi:MAG: pyrroline-5-carboxylate reductase [Azovibrio sp.]|uniref:pyrroline-5-carboxylate reductase n=1 Tax=Azovibrio sp. TaxID=1872673 RepID=UPI003C78A455
MKMTFLGGGNMATALVAGLLKQGFAAADIQVVERLAEQRQKLVDSYGIVCLPEVDARVLEGDVIVLAVKPQQMQVAVQPLAGHLQHQLVVSIAAGLTLETLSRWLGGYRRIVRAMPNTPAMIGAGMSGLCALPEVALNERLAAERILQTAGTTLWVEEESRMDAVTAISGSGPAYLFLFIEALQKAATELGFSPDEARHLAVATTLGAAQQAAASEEPASVLRQRVTSRGGTTEAALNVMQAQGVVQGIIAGVKAAEARGRELARQLGAG